MARDLEKQHCDRLATILSEFAEINAVKAIAMAGSRLGNYGDELSDFDLYIYSDEDVRVKPRTAIAGKYASCAAGFF